jgi:thiol-disulfide isomerase/thioredoxin
VTQTNQSEEGALRSDQSSLMFGEGFSFSGYERNPLYLNRGNGFLDISGVSGIDSVADGRAGVFADFDNDGDLDVFVSTIQGPAHLLYRNNVGQDGRNLRVELEGAAGTARSARDAFGAVVRIRTSEGVLTRIKAGGSGFISQHDPRLLFGLPGEEQAESIEVTWPGGAREVFAGPFPADTTQRLRQGAGRAEPVEVQVARLPDPLTRAQAYARDLRIPIGGPLPDLPLRTVTGEATSLRAALTPGRRAVVNLWATWCGPCRVEMPELEALRARLSARGVDIVGLNVDADPEADIAGYVEESGVGYPILVAGPDTLERIYASDEVTVPLSFLVDGEGVVTDLLPGWSDESRRRLEDLAGVRAAHGVTTPGAP